MSSYLFVFFFKRIKIFSLIIYAVFKVRYSLEESSFPSGDEGIRTPDPLLARQVLSQLSYTPIGVLKALSSGLSDLSSVSDSLKPMGLSGLEPPTSRLSGVRSNLLSYKPLYIKPLRVLFTFFDLAATCFPTPSPVQYPRPSGS